MGQGGDLFSEMKMSWGRPKGAGVVLVLILLLLSTFSQVTKHVGGERKILCISGTGFCLSCNLAGIPVSFSLPQIWCNVMMHLMEKGV